MRQLLDLIKHSDSAKRVVRLFLQGGARTLGALTSRSEFYSQEFEGIAVSFFETLSAKIEVRQRDVPDVTSFDAEEARSSDTVFILGGGASVNELDESDWGHVALHDAFGVNNWIVHDFVPDLYFYETPKDRELLNFFVSMCREKKEAYKEVPLFIQYPHMRRAGVNLPDRLNRSMGQIYYNVPFRYRTRSEFLLRRLLLARRALENIIPLTLGSLIHHAGSISYLIMFAMIAGYRKIVLVGVDMVDQKYFFDVNEENPYYKKIRHIRDSHPASGENSEHPTVDEEVTKSYGEIPLDEYILLFNEVFLRPSGVQLYVNSTRSKLYPKVQRYPFGIDSDS